MKKYGFVIILMTGLLAVLGSFVIKGPGQKEKLGEHLFFDPILSKDSTISCASCHRPEFAFADTSSVSIGHAGARGTRNTPTSMNLLLGRHFFWDGRANTLQEQALAPIANPVEMNLPIPEAVARLKNNERYHRLFMEVFGQGPDSATIGEALAAFERTLETSDSPFDEWKFLDDPSKVSEEAKRGFAVFNNKGQCIQCHFGADLTTNEFRNIGLFNGTNLNDSGRMLVTGNPDDLGKFKTSSLRNVAVTAPYMHNGMFRTLKEVIAFYDDPVKVVGQSINRDTILIKPLGLSEQEKSDLEAFLHSLTDKRFASHNSSLKVKELLNY